MYIKKIVEYTYNYAEYIVTDGKNELKCVCSSVPLSDGREPENNMKIDKIFAFSINGIQLKKIIKEKEKKYLITKSLFNPLGYKLRCRILNSNKAIVKIFDFELDLSNDYPNGFGYDFENGDYIEFSTDRLDCLT